MRVSQRYTRNELPQTEVVWAECLFMTYTNYHRVGKREKIKEFGKHKLNGC